MSKKVTELTTQCYNVVIRRKSSVKITKVMSKDKILSESCGLH